jgi:predicted NUDIX family NTP pyrophosphohydrolase
MPVTSAGILVHRLGATGREYFLVHPGGPFWARKDDGAWSIPKGVYSPDETAETAARREFQEETGVSLDGPLVALGAFRQPGGKIVTAFAIEGDVDAAGIRSNSFTMEWPPRSGRSATFPEIDRAAWFDPATAAVKILKGQRFILEALHAKLRSSS